MKNSSRRAGAVRNLSVLALLSIPVIAATMLFKAGSTLTKEEQVERLEQAQRYR